MKTGYLLIICVIVMSVFTACKDDEPKKIVIDAAPILGYNTDSILTLVFNKELDASSLGLDDKAYNPVGMRRCGDTLFIANRADGNDGVLIVNVEKNEVIYNLTGWTFEGKEEKFDNQIMDVAVNKDYIFVVNRSSRIDMFRRDDYSYITTIGRTGWEHSSLLQCESAEVVGDKLFIRDKHHVKVVLLSDCKPENRFKVPVFAQNTDSTSKNNGFRLETVSCHKGLVYVSDYESSSILVINPSSVTDENKKINFLRSYRTKSKPLSMGFYNDEMYVICDNKTISIIDIESGNEIKTFSSLAGGVGLATPGRIIFYDDDFYITQQKAEKSFINGKVMYIEKSELN